LDIIHTIHQEKPKAKIIIALTTPSPYDTKATYPNKDPSICPYYTKFHREGFVSSMNHIIWKIFEDNEKEKKKKTASIPNDRTTTVAAGLWGINDRYSHVIQNLFEYQMPCNIHFNDRGYRHLARKSSYYCLEFNVNDTCWLVKNGDDPPGCIFCIWSISIYVFFVEQYN